MTNSIDEDDVVTALTKLVQSNDTATIADLHDEINALRDEVATLRDIIKEHDHKLTIGGVQSRNGTPDQRAVAIRLQLWHEARLSPDGRVSLHWKELNNRLGGGYFKAQIYSVMERAAYGETEQGGKSKLQPAKGFEIERAKERPDGWTKLVCTLADIEERESLFD